MLFAPHLVILSVEEIDDTHHIALDLLHAVVLCDEGVDHAVRTHIMLKKANSGATSNKMANNAGK